MLEEFDINDFSIRLDVVIRTNGGELAINAANDTVKHYNYVNILNITAVDDENCYREYGKVGTATILEGKFVVDGADAFVAQIDVKGDATLEVSDKKQVGYVVADNNENISGCEVNEIHKTISYAEDGTYTTKNEKGEDVSGKAYSITTKEELINALTNKDGVLTGYDKVLLKTDLNWEETQGSGSFNIAISAQTTLDLNGHNITITEKGTSGSSHGVFLITSKDFTIVDTIGSGFIKCISNSDANVDLIHVGNTNGGKFTLESGALILEQFAGSGNCAFSGAVDVMTNASNVTCEFIMNGGALMANGKGQEAVRLNNNGNSGALSKVTINNGYLNGDIYFQGTAVDKNGETLVINGGTIIAKRPIRSTYHTMSQSKWGLPSVTLNGGTFVNESNAFAGDYLSYDNIIGTSYNYNYDITGWTAEKIFNITDNR